MDDLKLYGSNDNEIDSLVKVVKILSWDETSEWNLDLTNLLSFRRKEERKFIVKVLI